MMCWLLEGGDREPLCPSKESGAGRLDEASVEIGMGMARHRRPAAESEHKSEGTTIREPEAVRIGLLGGFRVSVGTRIIGEDGWRLRKAASLVKLLALAQGHRLHRERVMDLLWPQLGVKAASNNLRQVVHAARRTLASAEGSRYLASDNESLVLCPAGSL
jgi:two-component SAPR family response regulator